MSDNREDDFYDEALKAFVAGDRLRWKQLHEQEWVGPTCSRCGSDEVISRRVMRGSNWKNSRITGSCINRLSDMSYSPIHQTQNATRLLCRT